jgi:hypothetical protein
MRYKAPRAWEKKRARRRSAPVEPETVDPEIAAALRDVPTEHLIAFLRQSDLVESAITRRALNLESRAPDGMSLAEIQAHAPAEMLDALAKMPEGVVDVSALADIIADKGVRRAEKRIAENNPAPETVTRGLVEVGSVSKSVERSGGRIVRVVERHPDGSVVVKDVEHGPDRRISAETERKYQSEALARAGGIR